MVLSQRERIIAAHAYMILPHDVYDEIQRFGVVYQCIYPEPAYIISWVHRVICCTQIRSHVKAMLYTTYSKRETAATMCKSHPEPGMFFKHPAKDH